MFGLGFTELLVILAIVLVVFGAGKLPQVGDSLGKAIKNFKRASSGNDELEVAKKKEALAGKDEKESLPAPAEKVADAEIVVKKTEEKKADSGDDARRETAKKMLAKGMAAAEIAELTGLSEDEVGKLKA